MFLFYCYVIFFYFLGKNKIGDSMIEGYQIKNIDNEEVLYIYLNYSYEFGNLENNIFTNLKNNIKKYLAKLKINRRK